MQAIAANPGPWQKAVDAAEQSLAMVLSPCSDNQHDDGLINLEGLDELTHHLRHLVRIMQSAPGYLMQSAQSV
jgi:hypothetical protein